MNKTKSSVKKIGLSLTKASGALCIVL